MASTPAQTLEEALHAGDAAQVKKLLEQGANPNTEISGVGPALLFVCTSKDIAGADVNQPYLINGNPSGLSALKMTQNNRFDELCNC